MNLQFFSSKGPGKTVPTKSGGGSDPADFVNPHAEKHIYLMSFELIPNISNHQYT
jgi:hypothetical protein